MPTLYTLSFYLQHQERSLQELARARELWEIEYEKGVERERVAGEEMCVRRVSEEVERGSAVVERELAELKREAEASASERLVSQLMMTHQQEVRQKHEAYLVGKEEILVVKTRKVEDERIVVESLRGEI